MPQNRNSLQIHLPLQRPMPLPHHLAIPSNFKFKAQRRAEARRFLRKTQQDEDKFLDEQITWAEDLHTKHEKANPSKLQTAVTRGTNTKLSVHTASSTTNS